MSTSDVSTLVWLCALFGGPLLGWWIGRRRYRRPRLQWSARAPVRILAAEVLQTDHGAVLRTNRVPVPVPHEMTDKGIRFTLPALWPKGRLTTVTVLAEGPAARPQAAALDAGTPLVGRNHRLTGDNVFLEMKNFWVTLCVISLGIGPLLLGRPPSGDVLDVPWATGLGAFFGLVFGFAVFYVVFATREFRPLLRARLPGAG